MPTAPRPSRPRPPRRSPRPVASGELRAVEALVASLRQAQLQPQTWRAVLRWLALLDRSVARGNGVATVTARKTLEGLVERSRGGGPPPPSVARALTRTERLLGGEAPLRNAVLRRTPKRFYRRHEMELYVEDMGRVLGRIEPPPAEPVAPRKTARAAKAKRSAPRRAAAAKPAARRYVRAGGRVTAARRRASARRVGSPAASATRTPSPPPSPPTVDVGFNASMPAVVALGDTVDVAVVLSREALAAAAGRASAGDRARVSADAKLLLRVVPRLGFEVAGEDRVELDVPGRGAPQRATFRVKAVHASPGEVWVLASQCGLPVTVLKLPLEIVDGGVTAAAAIGAAGVAPVSAEPPSAPISRFEIVEQERGGSAIYRYEVDLPAAQVFKSFESKPIENRESYVAGLYRQLETWARNPGDAADLQADLQGFGANLFDELLPRELQELLWAHRDELHGAMVLSTEPFIPWELVHLKEPGGAVRGDELHFLGQAGIVRWLWGTSPPRRLRVRGDKRRYVIPRGGDLDSTTAEARMLVERLGASPIDPHLGPVRAALAEEDGFDLLHYAGHARADGADIEAAQLLLDAPSAQAVAAPLLASTVRQHGAFGSSQHRPIVVLNACQSGRSGIQLTSLGGFAEAFLGRCAGAFVGTLWAVGDEPALAFVDALYERLLAGDTFAAATAAARERARADGDPTWLAYTVYAQPDATVEWV